MFHPRLQIIPTSARGSYCFALNLYDYQRLCYHQIVIHTLLDLPQVLPSLRFPNLPILCPGTHISKLRNLKVRQSRSFHPQDTSPQPLLPSLQRHLPLCRIISRYIARVRHTVLCWGWFPRPKGPDDPVERQSFLRSGGFLQPGRSALTQILAPYGRLGSVDNSNVGQDDRKTVDMQCACTMKGIEHYGVKIVILSLSCSYAVRDE